MAIPVTPDGSAENLLSLEALYLERDRLERALLSPVTRTGYSYDYRAFLKWTTAMKLESLPASVETICLYATSLLAKGRKANTVYRYLAGISRIHRDAGHPVEWMPRVLRLLSGARRTREETLRQMTPLSIDDVRAIASMLTARGGKYAIRNRAILLVGVASALRSANLVSLQLADVTFVAEGAILKVRREKQDQEGKGRLIGIPSGQGDTCPVRALRDWIEVRGKEPGALFIRLRRDDFGKPLCPPRICTLVQQLLTQCGRDPKGFGAHSLRACLISEGALAGCGELNIAQQSGHSSMTVLRRYFRKRDLFRANVAGRIGL